MDTKVTAVASTPEVGQVRPAVVPQGEPPPILPKPDPVLDLRLVIEEDQGSGWFVYKTVNRVTGEVISSLPRAELLRLRAEAKYAAGSVVKTRA